MILTIGPGGCGFTFLNWTISFLRGDNFYQTLDGTLHTVSSDPFDGATAHNSIKDHLLPDQSKSLLSSCHQHSIVYVVPGSQCDYEYIVSLPGRKIIFDPTTHSEQILARCCTVLEDSNYLRFLNALSETYDKATVKKVLVDCHKMLVEYYRPVSDNEFYMLDYSSMFQSLDQHIHKMFDFLKITIDTDRLGKWHEIYEIYKEKNNQDFSEKFIGDQLVMKSQQTAILKEILLWKHEIYEIHKKNNQDFNDKFIGNQPVMKSQQTAILKEILS
jgi:hypothetical protein